MSSPLTNQDFDDSTVVQQKKRSKTVVPPSNIATRSRAIPAPQDIEITEGHTSPTQNLTSKDSNSPDTNQVVLQQGNNFITLHNVCKL